MKTVEVKLYKFDELEADVQEKIIDRIRESSSSEFWWWDDYKDSLNAFVDVFGLKWEGSNFDYTVDIQTSRLADFGGVANLRGNRLRTWIVNNMYHLLHKPQVYQKNGKNCLEYRKRTSMISVCETCCPFTGFYVDNDLLQPFREFVAKRGTSGTSFGFNIDNRYDKIDLEDIIIEANIRFDRCVNADYEYQCGRENALELIHQCAHDYTERGEIY